MKNCLGKIVFILASYNKHTEKFFERNPSLISRVPYRLQFVYYTDEVLNYERRHVGVTQFVRLKHCIKVIAECKYSSFSCTPTSTHCRCFRRFLTRRLANHAGKYNKKTVQGRHENRGWYPRTVEPDSHPAFGKRQRERGTWQARALHNIFSQITERSGKASRTTSQRGT